MYSYALIPTAAPAPTPTPTPISIVQLFWKNAILVVVIAMMILFYLMMTGISFPGDLFAVYYDRVLGKIDQFSP